jgi:hypothetical protein
MIIVDNHNKTKDQRIIKIMWVDTPLSAYGVKNHPLQPLLDFLNLL